MYNLQDLNAASPEELLEIAKTFDIKKADKKERRRLEQLADIPILRYRKVKAEMNPFDPEWQEYMTWKLRAKRELTKGKTSRKAS